MEISPREPFINYYVVSMPHSLSRGAKAVAKFDYDSGRFYDGIVYWQGWASDSSAALAAAGMEV